MDDEDDDHAGKRRRDSTEDPTPTPTKAQPSRTPSTRKKRQPTYIRRREKADEEVRVLIQGAISPLTC